MASSPPSKKLKVVSPYKSSNNPVLNIFAGLKICIIEQSIGKTRCKILHQQITKHGGTINVKPSSSTSHLLVAAGMKKERLRKILKVKALPIDDMKVLNVDWLSSCLVSGILVDHGIYQVFKDVKEKEGEDEECHSPVNIKPDVEVIHAVKEEEEKTTPKSTYAQLLELKHKRREEGLADDDSDYLSDDEDYHGGKKKGFTQGLVSTDRPSGTWVCARPSSSINTNHNEHITQKLEVLQKTYANTKDQWRAMSYKKAITSIKNYHKPLETYKEVKGLPCVGERLADKIWEIVETGHLRRLDHIDPKSELINAFAAVWGVGPTTAEQWVAQGYKSLEDLQNKADLTFQQKIGLKHYDDINEKMPREEVAEIEKQIRAIAISVLPGVRMEVCGSYRRGRSKCGDIDVLFSHPDEAARKSFLILVLDKLKETNVITDDLIMVENQEQRKYMGLCKLPGEFSKYRRIDFIVCPFNEWPLALVHFTGSAHFNRSIRLLAKKKNMSLSEHALRKDVIRVGGEKLNKGTDIPVSSEEDIFKYFGLDYLKPTERDW